MLVVLSIRCITLSFHLMCSIVVVVLTWVVDQVIGVHAKLGQHTLAMEGMLTIICDTPNCSDYDSILSTITLLRRDQATIGQLKKYLVAEKKLTIQLKDNITKLKEDNTRFLKQNGKPEADLKQWSLI